MYSLTIIISLSAILFSLGFIYWRAPWARAKVTDKILNDWFEHDLNMHEKLPPPIIEAAFESFKLTTDKNSYIIEINGSKPVILSLSDSTSHWSKPNNLPEMLAMYGLQYAASCLRKFYETKDNRWLDKFDKALDIAESEAYRELKKVFFLGPNMRLPCEW
jgi:hypothetical protein